MWFKVSFSLGNVVLPREKDKLVEMGGIEPPSE